MGVWADGRGLNPPLALSYQTTFKFESGLAVFFPVFSLVYHSHLQDKHLGDAFLVSSVVKSQRGNIFALALCWWILIGRKQHTSICTRVVTCSDSHLLRWMFPDKDKGEQTKGRQVLLKTLAQRSFGLCALGKPMLFLLCRFFNVLKMLPSQMVRLGWENLLFMGRPEPMSSALWRVRQQIK